MRTYICRIEAAAAKNYVEDDEPREDCRYEVVVLTPAGKRQYFAVDVTITRRYDLSRLED